MSLETSQSGEKECVRLISPVPWEHGFPIDIQTAAKLLLDVEDVCSWLCTRLIKRLELRGRTRLTQALKASVREGLQEALGEYLW